MKKRDVTTKELLNRTKQIAEKAKRKNSGYLPKKRKDLE